MPDIKEILDPLKVGNEIKAAAFDAFYDAADPKDLKARLDKINLPNEAKAQIWDLAMANPTMGQVSPLAAQSDPAMQRQPRQQSLIQNVTEYGPSMIGAAVGGLAGIPLGPTGVIGGAGLGAGIARTGQNAVRAAQGSPAAPQTFGQAMGDVSLATGMGVLQEAPVVAARAMYPMVTAAAPYQGLVRQPMTYRQAVEFKANAPVTTAERNIGNVEARTQLAGDIRTARNTIQNQSQQQLAAEINPLRDEQELLRNARTRNRTALQQERAIAEQSHTLAPKVLRAEKASEIGAAKLKAGADANAFAKSIGQEMDTLTMAGKAKEARESLVKRFQERIGDKYDQIREFFSLPENSIAVPKPTSEESLGVSDISDLFTPQATSGAIETISAPASLSRAKDELRPIYEQLKAELQVARQQGSPGANLVIQFMEGPDVIDGATLIQNLKAANQIGYAPGDYLLKNPTSRGLARQVGNKLRDALETTVGELKVGRKEVRELFEGAKADLAKRDELFKSRPALSSRATIERWGDASKLANDPIGFQAWWKQMELDPGVQQAAKRDIIENLLGKDSREFAKNWERLSPEIKKTAFTPEEIANGDKIAGGQAKSMQDILGRYTQREQILNEQMAAETKVIRDKRAQLQMLQLNINELGTKIQTAQENQRAFLNAQRARLMEQTEQAKLELRRIEAAKRIDYLKQMREAKDKVEQVQRLKKAGWVLGGGLGLAYGGERAIRTVFDALGGFGK